MDQVFYWQRPVPLDWERALATLAPPNDRVAHLKMFWIPGTPASPIQRWAIYECTPIAFCPEKARDLVASPPCRCAVEYPMRQVCRRCQHVASATRDTIYRYLHTTGCVAEPFWVIEGMNGGHKYHYSLVEAEWDRALGGGGEPPEIGSLPYAEFDQRVLRRLTSLDRTRSAWKTLTAAQTGEEKAAEQAFRHALLDHAMAYDDALLESASRQLTTMDQPTLPTEPWEPGRWQDHYLRTGRLPGMSSV